jgi:hypothetical protein
MPILIWKNKGLLVVLYVIVCMIGTAEIIGVLHRNVGGIFSRIDFYTALGFSFLFAATWTYLTKDSFYKDKDGNKKKMETSNEFFWIKMKIWAYIFLGVSVLFFGNLIFHYFEPVN